MLRTCKASQRQQRILSFSQRKSPVPESSATHAIDVENLYKVFGSKPERALSLLSAGRTKDEVLSETGCTVAVDGASFSVKEGELFVVMGLSGSGKSTMLRCLNQLIEPTRGVVRIDGEDVTAASEKRLYELCRTKMSMVFQHFGLLPHRSVLGNVEYGLEVGGMDREKRREKAREAIELVGLKGYEHSMPNELSGGMQQRVGLARALANDPDILLMDEAFSALDPLIRAEMQDELISLQAEMRKTIVFITHDLDEALKLGDRIAIMKAGQIVQVGTPEKILTEPANDYVRSFVQNVDRTRVITATGIMHKPVTVVLSHDTSEGGVHGPAVAVRRMRQEGAALAYAIDQEQRFQGVVHIYDAVDLLNRNKKDLREVLVEDVPLAHKDTSVAALFPMAMEMDSDLPIAVVDDENVLQGTIDRASIVAEMITNMDEEGRTPASSGQATRSSVAENGEAVA